MFVYDCVFAKIVCNGVWWIYCSVQCLKYVGIIAVVELKSSFFKRSPLKCTFSGVKHGCDIFLSNNKLKHFPRQIRKQQQLYLLKLYLAFLQTCLLSFNQFSFEEFYVLTFCYQKLSKSYEDGKLLLNQSVFTIFSSSKCYQTHCFAILCRVYRFLETAIY